MWVVVFGFLVCALVGVCLIVFGIKELKLYRQMGRGVTAIADINDQMDTVLIAGKARAIGEPLKTHFSATDAVAHRWRVSVKTNSGEGESWVRYAVDSRDVQPFILEDETGAIFIEPEGAQLEFEESVYARVKKKEKVPEDLQRFLEEGGFKESALTTQSINVLRLFSESMLRPGENVYIFGPLQKGPAAHAPDGTVAPYVSLCGDLPTITVDGGSARFKIFDSDTGDTRKRQKLRVDKSFVVGGGFVAMAAAFAAVFFMV